MVFNYDINLKESQVCLLVVKLKMKNFVLIILYFIIIFIIDLKYIQIKDSELHFIYHYILGFIIVQFNYIVIQGTK